MRAAAMLTENRIEWRPHARDESQRSMLTTGIKKSNVATVDVRNTFDPIAADAVGAFMSSTRQIPNNRIIRARLER